MRIYKNKSFAKFARKEKISDRKLCEIVRAIENGKIDVNLGGGVIKQRVARENQGKSSGYRIIILYKKSERAFFVYGFAKKDMDNVTNDHEKALKKLATRLLNLSLDELAKQIQEENLIEVQS